MKAIEISVDAHSMETKLDVFDLEAPVIWLLIM